MKTSHVSPKDIAHLATLSALELSDQEVNTIHKQFEETLDYVNNLDDLDTSAVKASAHVSGQQNIFFQDGTTNTRLLTDKQAVKNSKKQSDGYFVVDRIL